MREQLRTVGPPCAPRDAVIAAMLQACAARSRGTAHMLAALLCVAAAEGRSGVRGPGGGFLDKQAAQHNRDDYCVELVAVTCLSPCIFTS